MRRAEDDDTSDDPTGESEAVEAADPDPSGAGFVRRWATWVFRFLVSGVIVALVFGVVFYLRFRTELHRGMAPIGPRLAAAGFMQQLEMDDERPPGPRVLVLNGQRLQVRTEVVEASLEEALAQREEECPTREELGPGQQSDTDGYTICLHDETDPGPLDLGSRMDDFMDTMDVADLGTIQYVYGQESERGRTMLLTLETTETFRLDQLIPMEGDAQGSDPEDVPRPPDGRRIMHAFEENGPYYATIYGRSAMTVHDLTRWYMDNMDQALWTRVDYAAVAEARGETIPDDVDMLFYRRNNDPQRFVAIDLEAVEIREDDEGNPLEGQTMVTILEAR